MELRNILYQLGIEPKPELIEAIHNAVEADKLAEYEQGMLNALYCADCGAIYEEDCCCGDDDNDGLDECDACGGHQCRHEPGCIFSDPLDYNECGYG